MNARISLKVVCSLAIGAAMSVVLCGRIEGTPEIAQKEGQGCLVCHTAVGRAELNDRGTYYKAERTLEGYRPPEASKSGEPGGDQPPKSGEEAPPEPDEAPRPAPEPTGETPR